MTTNGMHEPGVKQSAPSTKFKRALPWIILAAWFVWLAALVAMSYPEWGKSKRELLEQPEPQVRRARVVLPEQGK